MFVLLPEDKVLPDDCLDALVGPQVTVQHLDGVIQSLASGEKQGANTHIK